MARVRLCEYRNGAFLSDLILDHLRGRFSEIGVGDATLGDLLLRDRGLDAREDRLETVLGGAEGGAKTRDTVDGCVEGGDRRLRTRHCDERNAVDA